MAGELGGLAWELEGVWQGNSRGWHGVTLELQDGGMGTREVEHGN